MWSIYWFEIIGKDSDICGEEFFTELKDASKVQHIAYANELFPDEEIKCLGKISRAEADMMGLDTY